MLLSSIDIVVIVVYLLLTVLFGSSFYFRSRTTSGFTQANGSLPSIVVGLSIFGTYVSSISFLALPGKAFISNWNAFVLSLTIPFAAWIAARWFVPFYRRCGTVSAYAHLETRFGTWARVYATVCYLLTQLARMGAILFLLALPLNALLGWNIALIIVVVGILTVLYSLLGGITGIIWTDALQSLVLISGALICVILIPLSMPHGPKELFTVAIESGKFSLGTFAPDFTQASFWTVFLYGLVINLQNFGIDQNYVQRYLTAQSDAQAKKSLWIGALLYIPVSAAFLFIGTALFAFYQQRPELLAQQPELLQKISAGNGDEIFPFFIVNQLPTGISGLLIAAIMAAAMSTVSTSLNGAATLSLTDFYTRFFRSKASDGEQMRVLRIATLIWGLIGIGCALAMIQAKGILDAWWTLSGIFSGGVVGLFLLGIVSKRISSRIAFVSVIIGLTVIVWLVCCTTISEHNYIWNYIPHCNLHTYMTAVIGTAVILLSGFALGTLCGKREN